MKRLAQVSVLLLAAVLVFGSRAQAAQVTGTTTLQVCITVTIDTYNSIAWDDPGGLYSTDPINLTLLNPQPGSQFQYFCGAPGDPNPLFRLKPVRNVSQQGTNVLVSVSISATGLVLADPPGTQPWANDQWGADCLLLPNRNGPMQLGPGNAQPWDCTIYTPPQFTHNQTGTITFTLTAAAQ
jgi:hypothetical protein